MGDRHWASGLLAVVLLLAVPTPATAFHNDGAHVVVTRVAGSDRTDTAVRLADQVPVNPFPCLRIPGERCQGVIVASASGYADALAGGPLASDRDSPVLLSHPDRLPEHVAAAIRRRKVEIAWILGGPAALSRQIDEDLRAAGVDRVIRIAGSDRFDTARKIALTLRESHPPGTRPATLFLASGSHPDLDRGWPDALAAAALARARPLLLVERYRLPQATREALEELGPGELVIVGGTAAVSEAVEDELRAIVDNVERIAGADRYETAWLAAQRAVAERGGANRVWLATGQDWPDALAAAPAISMQHSVLLLAHPQDLGRSVYVRSWVQRYRDEFEYIRIIGGLGAVGLGVEDELRRAVEPCHPSYPEVCIGPPPPQLTCDQIGYRNFTVVGDDPHAFDPQRTGVGCPSP